MTKQPSAAAMIADYKLHHKDLEVCINDAVAVHHVLAQLEAELLRMLPEKKAVGDKRQYYMFERGYNQAIAEVTHQLQAFFRNPGSGEGA